MCWRCRVIQEEDGKQRLGKLEYGSVVSVFFFPSLLWICTICIIQFALNELNLA